MIIIDGDENCLGFFERVSIMGNERGYELFDI